MKSTERILSFSPYAYWRLHALYEIAICHNLQWRGHSYNYVSCDGLFSDCDMFWESTVGPRPADACATCQAQVKATLEGARIPHLPLGKFKTPATLGDARAFERNLHDSELLDAVYRGHPVGAWIKSSVHSHLRTNELDLTNPKHCAALRSYLYSGAVAIDCITGMLDELQPTIMLLFNGRMSVPRIALELAKARGIRVVCHERGLSKETLLLWENEGCLALTPYEQLWKQWGEVPLAPEESAKVTQWLIDRAHGTNLNWKAFSVQSSLGPVAAFLEANQGRKIWTLFTSSTDEMVADRPSAFGTQYRWIEETIAFVRQQPGVALVIRVHPNSGGKKSTGKNLGEIKFFETLRATVPDNVMVVMPDDTVSSYALIDRTDLGFVYGSTVALEMACRGKRVLLAAHSPWMYCPAITLLTAPERYAGLLATCATAEPDAAEAERIAIAAFRFAYAYVQRWNIPFPLVKMPDIHSGAFAVKTLAELKPGVHACLDYCTEIVLGLRPSVPVATEPVRAGAAQAEIDALRSGLKTLAGLSSGAVRFSVVITCYNYAKFLRNCVRSVANQTCKDFELIIVNDGSTDDSQAVAEACRRDFSDVPIRVLNQPNSGQPALARNAGIRLAKGQYILPLDADDMIGPQYLEQASKLIDLDPAVDFICANAIFDDGKTKTLAQPGRFDARLMATKNQFVYCCVYRRTLWEKIGGYRDNVRGCEDWDFWVAIAVAGAKPGFIPCIGLIYNQKETGVYAETVAHHAARAAQIKANNPGAFPEESAPAASAPAAGAPVAHTTSRRIIALMSAFNEGDIIYHAIGDLIANGVDVYLLDNNSTDNTVSEASKWLGRGLLKIERFPEEAAGFAARCSKEFVLREQLRRKEELAAQLDGAWFLNVDADEFRESPWPDKTLAEGVREVDRLGYNAINFELLNFRPTDDAFVPGEDVRRHLVAYEPGELFDALQIKAWKNPGARVQLAANGGHSVGFDGRKVFPLNFILRHYPIRGETHGRRKIFQERLPRFAREEVAQQWHVQYNEFIDGGKKFLHRAEDLVVYQRDRFCAALLARFSSDLLLSHAVSGQVVGGARVQPAAALAWAGRSLEMTEPLSGEVGTQAEQLLGGLLQALSQKQEVPVAEIEPALRRLLLTLLEMKLAYARLTADAHFVGVGNRLRRLLEEPVATAAEPAGLVAAAPEPAEPTALVSICIPTYNGEEFIGETLRSALAQTYGQIEIIVSDDQSSDRTLEIVERLVPQSRFSVRILRHDRLGLVGNWSHCIAEARGKYIKFLFQDDLLDPDCVRQLVTVAESDPQIGLVFSPRRIEPRGDVARDPALAAAVRDSADVHRGWSRLRRVQDGAELLRDPRLLENPINKIGEPSTVLLAKEAITAVGGFDASLRQLVDVEMWLRLMTRYKVGFVDRALSCFRLHAKQTTQENLRNGLIAEDWRRFYAKLANDPAFATLPEPHRALARRASARVSAPVATAAMPSARPAAAGEFQRRMKEAEESVRHGRVQEAIARVEGALQVAPDEATASRAREILTMLADASANAASQPAATEPSGDDFFGADERANVEQLLAAYAANPADPAAREPVMALQRSLVDFLLGAEPGRLGNLFRGDFGQVFRAVIASGLPFEPASDESAAQVARIDAALAEGGASFAVRPLLARMLLAPAHRGFAPVPLERVPAWIEEDYFRFLLQAPPVFLRAGEAEQFHEHLLGCARMIWQRTRTMPKDPLTIRVASFFALKGSFVPTYFNALNVRELAEKRAAIMEFALRQRGAVIDATFKKRPKDRQRIKIGFLNAHFGAQTETHVTLPMLQLDRSKFEVCLFATAANEGPVEDRCRALADTFTVLPDNLNGQVRTIRDAQLDIVIIGTNVTAVTNQVALIALHRLAPVQLASYCSPVSTGMRHIDGYLTGSLLDSPEIRSHFTEQLHVCEGAPGCLDYAVEEPASLSGFDRARLGLEPDDVVFVNAAACFKILPQMVETWAAILQATPRSRLLLMPFNPNWSSAFPTKQFERSLMECFARHGLGRDRFVMVGSLPSRADVKALEQVADVYLDTMPFSGSISIVDPLEIGLPVVTATGQTHRSRMAAALLQELGLPDLVASDEAGYRALAIRLGTDTAFRRQSEERILAAMGRRPKFINPQAYAADLGRLLESLVKGHAPRPVLAEAVA